MRKAQPNCVTILLTGYPAFQSAVQTIRDQIDDYFVKPAELDSLVSTIERKLRARHYPTQSTLIKATPTKKAC
jgi:ActR/RegA family two-component response regulator